MRKSVLISSTGIRALASLTLCSICFSSCLRTRAQVREEKRDGPGTAISSTQSQDSSQSQTFPSQLKPVKPDGAYAVEEIKDEITRMEGRIEDLERANQQSSSGKTDDLKRLDDRVTQLEQTQMTILETLKKMQATQAAANVDPLQTFEEGKNAFQANSYDVAIDKLSTYLKSPNGSHIQEATYLRGEAYFKLKKYKEAIVDFSKFPEKYMHSKMTPKALLRIGQSFDALGMKDDGKGFFQELVDKFPHSPEARMARKKLK